VGADGANSRIRRKLVGPHRGERFVALEILTELDDPHLAHTAFFDFRPAARGLRGYAWHFPSRMAGRWIVNRGIGGSRWPAGTSLRALFRDALRQQGLALERYALQGWSAPLYHPDSPQSAPNVVLAGDAAGVDPWLGEGISVALGSGILAAHAAGEALERADFSFRDHASRLRESGVGWQLERKRAIADPFYAAAGASADASEIVLGAALP
jgi:flavin-dependent dehydrogenase